MNSLINDSSEKTLSLRPFTQPHLACFCNRFVVQATSMQFTVLTRQADCAFLFQSNHFFKCGRLPYYSARSLVVSQPACQTVEYPFSQVSLPFIQSKNFDFRDWIMSSVIFLSSPLSLHSATRRCILYFLYQNKSIFDYEIDISIR